MHIKYKVITETYFANDILSYGLGVAEIALRSPAACALRSQPQTIASEASISIGQPVFNVLVTHGNYALRSSYLISLLLCELVFARIGL